MKTADTQTSIVSKRAVNSKSDLKSAFDLCVRKSRLTIQRLADEPKSGAWAVDGNYFAHPEGFFEIGNWTSSFFTGMALIAWQQTEDEFFLDQVLRLAPAYREKACARSLDMHHDAGFLYSLYSVALYKLTGGKEHREVGLAAAKALAQRFNPTGNFIRAWGRMDTVEHDNMAIIDCLMNLPLLYWAAKETGDPSFQDIAIRHADMAMNSFVRADDSVFHAIRFDSKTGKVIGGDNFGGFSVDSFWARGASWAIYGFPLSYRHTGDRKYLDMGVRLARNFIAQLDGDVLPVWDFRLPPDRPRVRDNSAAAITVCGLQELARLGAVEAVISSAKTALLDRLCMAENLDFHESSPGILKCAYGDKPAYSSWGDYFLMEALARELFGFQPWW